MEEGEDRGDRHELFHQLETKSFGIDARLDITERSKSIGLCGSCTNAFVRKYKHSNEFQVLCQANYEDVREVVDEVEVCSAYTDKLAMDLHTMSQIAILIDIDKIVVGFNPKGGKR